MDKIRKLQIFDSSYFRGKNQFEGVGTQNYLVFQPMYRQFKKIGNGDHISLWKSKGLSDESIKPPTTSNNSLAPALNYADAKTSAKLIGSFLKQDKITFMYGNIVNIYIAYEINT